jgi:hypothetical protein
MDDCTRHVRRLAVLDDAQVALALGYDVDAALERLDP